MVISNCTVNGPFTLGQNATEPALLGKGKAIVSQWVFTHDVKQGLYCVCICGGICVCALSVSVCRGIHSYQIQIPQFAKTAGTGGEQHLTFTTIVPHWHANMAKHQLSQSPVAVE